MKEPLDSSVPSPTIIGEGYSFDEIRTFLDGESTPPHFVIHRGETVLGLCLGLLWNPRAESSPCEVWVGRKAELAKWGDRLAQTTGPLPVYVRRVEGGKWFYIGLRAVTGKSTELDDIRQRINPPAITGISQIVFLKKAAAR